MTKQEHRHLLYLACDILVDANISFLPVDLNSIATLYNMSHLLNKTKSRYTNALILSKNILARFGYKHDDYYSEFLTVRILAPMIILVKINVLSAKEISKLSEIPLDIAIKRYRCYKNHVSKNVSNTTQLESYVLSQFGEWIFNYRLHGRKTL